MTARNKRSKLLVSCIPAIRQGKRKEDGGEKRIGMRGQQGLYVPQGELEVNECYFFLLMTTHVAINSLCCARADVKCCLTMCVCQIFLLQIALKSK